MTEVTVKRICNPGRKNCQRPELVQRIDELEDENRIFRQTESVDDSVWDMLLEQVRQHQAQINAMKELPDKWRSEIIQNPTYTGTARNRRTKECAGELDNITG